MNLLANPIQSNKSSKQFGFGIKNRHTDQWNRLESLDISPHSYNELIQDKRCKNIEARGKKPFTELY